jgi:hypothetical protein
MSSPRAFISFDFDHNSTDKLLFAGQTKNSRTPFEIADWSSKTHLPQREWEQLISNKISKCNLLIVLVGRKTSTATGVAIEIALANEKKIPVFGVYVDGAGSITTLPVGLARSRTISWDWAAITEKINGCMKEGKNCL